MINTKIILIVLILILLILLLYKNSEQFNSGELLTSKNYKDMSNIISELNDNNKEKQMKYHRLNSKILQAQDRINYCKDNLRDYI